jgi:hypothetical protein
LASGSASPYRRARRRRGRAARRAPRSAALGAPQRGLGEEEEVARPPLDLPVRALQVERHRVLRVLGRGRAGVEDHVVVGQLGHAGHDALGLLVQRVGGTPRPLHAAERAADLVPARAQQRGVVEPLRPGERVVALGLGGQLGGARAQRTGVLEQVRLHVAEALLRRRGRGGPLGLVVVAAAASGDQARDEREDQRHPPEDGAIGHARTPVRCCRAGG